MRRILLSALLTLFIAANALAANLYVDNRVIADGTGKTAGSDTTHIASAGFALNTGWTNADLTYAGLTVTAGTNAPAVTKPFKIISVDLTTPSAPIFEVHQTFNGANTPQTDWTFKVTYGCNANTTYNTATKAASLTGPRVTPYLSYNGSSNGDTIWFRKSGVRYNGTYDASASYLVANSNGRSVTLDGYTSTTGDMSTSGARVTQAQADAFPVIDNPAAAYTIATDPALTNPTTITIKHLTIINASSSGAALRSNSAAGQFVVDEAQIQTSDMASNGFTFIESTTSGVTKAHSFTNSILYSDNTLVYGGCWKSLTIDNCTMNGGGAAYFFNLFGAEGSATNHPLKIDIKNNTINYDYPSGTAAVIRGKLLTNCEFRLTNNTATVNHTANFLDIQSGLHFAVIDGNTITHTNETDASTCIGLGLDTAPVQSPMHSTVTIVASPLSSGTVPATNQVTLATGSTTDDFYNGMYIRVPSTDICRRITDYVGSTKVATIWGTWGSNPAAGTQLEIFTADRTYTYYQVTNNNIRFTGDKSHGILAAQGLWGGIYIKGNKLYDCDNALVIKCEGAEISQNYAYSGAPLLLKGGSFNYVHNNTFICNDASQPAVAFQDRSAPVENLHGVEFSHCTGNTVINNIIVGSIDGVLLMNDDSTDAGSWSDNASLSPLRQNNLIDYNVYYRPDVADDGSHGLYRIYNVDTGLQQHIGSLSAMRTQWAATVTADGLPFGRMFPTNDAHSVYGTITFASPATGDFRVTGGTAANTLGSDGQPVGAGRAIVRLLPR